MPQNRFILVHIDRKIIVYAQNAMGGLISTGFFSAWIPPTQHIEIYSTKNLQDNSYVCSKHDFAQKYVWMQNVL